MQTDRDRLIELLQDCETEKVPDKDGYYRCYMSREKAEYYADYLLSNGVIVSPCKVGDTVWYELYGEIESAVVYSCIGVLKKQGFEITDANAKSSDGLEVVFTGKCIGKTIFLTKEDAEEKLRWLGK